MKLKPFTVVSLCLCGCDEHQVHWTRATDGDNASERVKQRLERNTETEGGRDIEVIAVFHGHLSNQVQ